NYNHQRWIPPSHEPTHLDNTMARLSGLQRDVLSLYRSCLRAARKKPASTRGNFENFARREFEKNIHMDRKDFSTIEFLLRKGQRQLETFQAENITNIAG
ncbi:Succinate dehydrogenase assembly factor 1, mitochondrial, partial [Pseudocercospora fuligena]